MVACVRPKPRETIIDPACGTGGFMLAAYEFVSGSYPLDADQKRHLRLEALHGVDIVEGVVRLCAMILLLHGIGPTLEGGEPPVKPGDSLAGDPGDRHDVVLTNPPFGRKSSVTVIGGDGEQSRESLEIVRDDFWATTSNKQLNFLQHVKTIMAMYGRAAVVVPDNVLFEGGAGETNPLQRSDLDEFVTLFNPENRHERMATWSEENPDGRWRAFAYDELVGRDKVSLDITCLRDESLEDAANLPDPDVITLEIVEDLRAALEEFELIAADLGSGVA